MNIAILTKLPKKVTDELPAIIDKYQINTPLRLSHFLSQCHHESGGFKSVSENMKYSEKRLMQVFPRHFPTIESTKGYSMHPERIGNKVYANRLGNRDESSGDGFKYRGRGYIQCTGRHKFAILDKLLHEDILNNPDWIATKYPLFSAAWFWDSVKLNQIADKGSSLEICEQVTKKVNGGKLGLLARYKHFVYYYELLKIG
jgi:putative chitinase